MLLFVLPSYDFYENGGKFIIACNTVVDHHIKEHKTPRFAN